MKMTEQASQDTSNYSDNDATPPDNYINVGGFLKTKREEKKLSLRALASLAKISYAELSRIENGKVTPTTLTLKKIAPYLAVPYDELLFQADYSFQAKGDDPIYLDLQGNVVNLMEKAIRLYTKNVELFFLLDQWFDYCSNEDEEMLTQLLALSIKKIECEKKPENSLSDKERGIRDFMEGIRCLTKSGISLFNDILVSENEQQA